MMTLSRLTPDEDALRHWMPALAAGLCAWLAFLTVGNTPLIRASALALVVFAVALMLRRWGALLAATGSLALAFSPAFWSQTGGADKFTLSEVVIALVIAALGAALAAWVLKRPALAVVVGIAIFAALFGSVFGAPRSLRLTTLLASGVLYLLFDALMVTNPRPDEAVSGALRVRHTIGILLLLIVGVLNDPLFILLIPAVSLALFLSQARLPAWYGAALAATALVGAWGIAMQYLNSGWWLYPAAQAEVLGYRVPFVMADGWRAASRWIYLLALLVEQFTPLGLALGVIGLARLSRWYPPLGVVSMVAYGSYFAFGLVYFGRDSAVLLLPLFIIQVLWITYAVYSFGHWLQRSTASTRLVSRWLVPAAFSLLPLFMLLRITGVI